MSDRIIVLNDPVNLIDPWGLWSITGDVYPLLGLGGGLTIGQNPNGAWFLTGRLGVGLGGGVSFDKDGTSPDPCQLKTGPKVGSLGAYGEGNLSLGPTFFGFLHNVGVSVTETREIYEYNNTAPVSGNSMTLGIRGSIAVGIEGSLNLNSFFRYIGF